jgi:GTP-binding protein Era
MNFRSGYITLVGVPNAGKSSLVNALVKESVSIVTSKPQTTRKRTLGILTKANEYQIVFVDTPGIIESNDGLNPILKKELDQALENVDVVVCAIAPWEFLKDEKPWSVKLGETIKNIPLYIATQCDKIPDKKVITDKWNLWFAEGTPPPLLLTSSRTNKGLDELMEKFISRLPEGPQYYDTEIYTPQTMREVAGEVIRKYCFEQVHQELPYGMAVLVRKFEENKIIKIEADIIVSRESHKPMVIGQGASVLKQIGVRSRFELERIFNQKIFLKLHVVAKPGWIKDKSYLQELGYDAN